MRVQIAKLNERGGRLVRAAVSLLEQASDCEDKSEKMPQALTWLSIEAVAQAPSVTHMLTHLHDWLQFDIFELDRTTSGRPLSVLMAHLFSQAGLFETFAISRDVFARFVTSLEDKYTSVTYHNRIHAADVAHNTFLFLTSLEAARAAALHSTTANSSGANAAMPTLFDPMDTLCAILAAGAHDVAHVGVTNLFYINTKSELALCYNDKSVLENMHVAQTRRLLAKPELDFISHFTSEQKKHLHRQMADVILATDMADHRLHERQLRELLNCAGWQAQPTAEQRQILLRTVVHTADIANPTKATPVVVEWTKRLYEEFFLQGDEEKALGLPISMNCNRASDNIAAAQVQFYDLFVREAFAALLPVMPLSSTCLAQLQVNRAHWQADLAQQAAQ